MGDGPRSSSSHWKQTVLFRPKADTAPKREGFWSEQAIRARTPYYLQVDWLTATIARSLLWRARPKASTVRTSLSLSKIASGKTFSFRQRSPEAGQGVGYRIAGLGFPESP